MATGPEGNRDSWAIVSGIYARLCQANNRPIRLALFEAIENRLADPYYRRRVDSAEIGASILRELLEFNEASGDWSAQVFGLFLAFRMAKENAVPRDKRGSGPFPHKLYTRRRRADCVPGDVADECEQN